MKTYYWAIEERGQNRKFIITDDPIRSKLYRWDGITRSPQDVKNMIAHLSTSRVYELCLDFEVSGIAQ